MADKNITTPDPEKISLFDWRIHLIPEGEKNEEWALKIFKRYVPGLQPIYNVDYWGTRRYGQNDIKGYATGTQDGTQYKVMFDPQDRTGKYLGLNFDNLPAVIPRFRQKLIADLQKIPVDVQAVAVDPIANNQRGRDKQKLKIQKALDEKLAELSKIIGYEKPIKSGIAKKVLNPSMGTMSGGKDPSTALENIQFDLEDDYELQIFMDKSSGFYNQDVELVQEIAIDAIFKLNKIENQKQLCIEDAVDYGRAAMQVTCNKFTGMPEIVYNPVETILVPASWQKDFNDVECWARNPLVTMNQLLRLIGDCLTPDDVREIFNVAVRTYGYRDASGIPFQQWTQGGWAGRPFTWIDFDIVKVPLFYLEFRSPNYDVYEESTTRYGDKKVKKKDFYYNPTDESKKRREAWYDCIYKGYYIQGIDRVYDFGKLNNMIREKGSEKMTPYSLIYWRFEDRSAVEKMIPHADNIIVAWLKLQYTLLHSKVSGISWNVDAISDIVLGDGGTITAVEIAKMYEQTGSTFHHTRDESGTPMMANANAPHMILPNGLDPNLMLYWNTIRNEMQMMSDSVGLNEFTDASTPNPDALVGIQKQAVLNSNDARYYLQYGTKKIIENCATRTSLLIQQILKYNPAAKEQLKNMIGSINVEMIDILDQIPLHQFAIYLENTMSEQEKQEVKQFLLMSYQQGKLDLSDVLQLYFIKNYKLMSKLLALKYNKRAAQQAQQAQMGMQMQQQTEMQVAQLKMQLQAMENEGKQNVAEITGKYSILEENVKQQGDMSKKILQEISKLHVIEAKKNADMELAETGS